MLSVGARDKLAVARAIMLDYARRSGLSTTDVPPHRYLWTDAFAVCNYVELHRRTEERRFLDLALALVDQLHHTLARFAPDDPREGWISGLPEAEGERHPTRGGLRIGKKLLERGADELFDERLEWERDGQYFHYLTRWMHALDCVARVTEEVKYSRWALELARSAFRGFVQPQPASGGLSMVWKMSIDLSRPLVPSLGRHDPLDGLLTFMAVAAAAERFGGVPAGLELAQEISAFDRLCDGSHWATSDTLGTGGLLVGAAHLAQLLVRLTTTDTAPSWLPDSVPRERNRLVGLLRDAAVSIDLIRHATPFSPRAERRLAFRELGLSIGFHGLDLIAPEVVTGADAAELLDDLQRSRAMGKAIERFWLDASHQRNPTWTDHQDINGVMLATSLAPWSYLDL